MPEVRSDDRWFRELVDYVTGDADEPVRVRVRAAMSESEETASTVRRIEEVIGALRESGYAPAPEDLQRRIRDLIGVGSWMRPSPGDFIALITQDSREESELAGYRGAQSAFQLVFEADGIEIVFQMAAAKSGSGDGDVVSVMGQIDGLDEDEREQGEVEVLTVMGAPVTRVAIDEEQYFAFTVPVGTYDVSVQTGQRRIVASGIEVG